MEIKYDRKALLRHTYTDLKAMSEMTRGVIMYNQDQINKKDDKDIVEPFRKSIEYYRAIDDILTSEMFNRLEKIFPKEK